MVYDAWIFTGGDWHADACLSLLSTLPRPKQILAADAGYKKALAANVIPTDVVGDFDSMARPTDLPDGVRLLTVPAEKDDTDTMLALRCGLDRGQREFHIYGGMDGRRLDHTMANFQSLAFLRRHGANGFLIGQDFIATVIQNESVTFPRADAGLLSVFCLGADARGVTLQGLQYPLDKHTLTCDFPLGVSNHFIGECGKVSVENGTLLLIWERKIGFPTVTE